MTHKLILNLDFENGIVMPDNKIKDWVHKCVHGYKLSRKHVTIDIGGELVLLAFRALIKKGIIDHSDVIIRYNGIDFAPNIEGRVPELWAELTPLYDELLMEFIA